MEENQTLTREQMRFNSVYRFFLYVGIIIIAFNLRPAITSVGPVIGFIRDDIGLSNWSAGIITSLPLLAFAVISPIAPKIGNRISNGKALILGLVLLLCGIGIRSISTVTLLYLGTFIVGAGIAFCNVLLPAVIKEKFPKKVELMTGIYSTAMGAFAATASGLSVPLARGLNFGWQLALIVWMIPAILGIVIWFYLVKGNKEADRQRTVQETPHDNRIWFSPLAWQVACFMGFQSFVFYVTISWLPEMLQAYGVSISTGGWMLSFAQLIGLPFSLFVPVIAGRFKSQWWLVCLLCLCGIGGFAGLLLGHSYPIMIVSVILIGILLGSIFPLALTFIGMRARDARQASELSGMAQSLGYLMAAIGPIAIGYLSDVTGSWKVPLVVVLGIILVVMIFGSLAGRDRYVLD